MIILVLGGARSGKSLVAEQLAKKFGKPVTYLATLHVDGDPELAERVRRHRARRPDTWLTQETGKDVPGVLRAVSGPVVLDALGPWVAASDGLEVDSGALCRALKERLGDTVVVSEEVGFGVHPSTEIGRRFRDALGQLNQAVASVADDVILVVAGRVLRIDNALPDLPSTGDAHV